jgi:hypothetical protein
MLFLQSAGQGLAGASRQTLVNRAVTLRLVKRASRMHIHQQSPSIVWSCISASAVRFKSEERWMGRKKLEVISAWFGQALGQTAKLYLRLGITKLNRPPHKRPAPQSERAKT